MHLNGAILSAVVLAGSVVRDHRQCSAAMGGRACSLSHLRAMRGFGVTGRGQARGHRHEPARRQAHASADVPDRGKARVDLRDRNGVRRWIHSRNELSGREHRSLRPVVAVLWMQFRCYPEASSDVAAVGQRLCRDWTIHLVTRVRPGGRRCSFFGLPRDSRSLGVRRRDHRGAHGLHHRPQEEAEQPDDRADQQRHRIAPAHVRRSLPLRGVRGDEIGHRHAGGELRCRDRRGGHVHEERRPHAVRERLEHVQRKHGRPEGPCYGGQAATGRVRVDRRDTDARAWFVSGS